MSATTVGFVLVLEANLGPTHSDDEHRGDPQQYRGVSADRVEEDLGGTARTIIGPTSEEYITCLKAIDAAADPHGATR